MGTMRRRILVFAALACVVIAVVYAALSNKPPDPFVRVDDFGATSYHLQAIECVAGREVQHFQRDDGRPMGSAITDYAC
jgi:hypothetical protein